jgi:peroxiredoxin
MKKNNTIKTVPKVTFKTLLLDKDFIKTGSSVCPIFDWQDLSTKDIFAGKKVIVFALPGAYTPTCSGTHLPGYEAKYSDFKKLSVDEVYCLSVNDAFVMLNWFNDLEIKNVKFLPDGALEFTKKMKMLVKKDNLGFGNRSWRYSMYVVDGKIQKIFAEAGKKNNCPTDPFEVSDADTMLDYLKK